MSEERPTKTVMSLRTRISLPACFVFFIASAGFGQSASFKTFMNPVIPGDHPDCTVTKVGNDFYTTGSSFNPTPVIYHSTDLVHWEAIAQPVSAAWQGYGDTPSGGCWGGQVVYYNKKYWDFFSRSNVMYFVYADDIRGPWSLPTAMTSPAIVPGLGYDNSIFIDDDESWYLLVKNGQVNNWIVQLGNDGQPSGKILNMCWINPAPSYPFSWAEGPVMWKYKGNYYYSFARNVAGGQIVFRSSAFTDDQSSWVNLGNFFNESDPLKSQALFQNPNHSSAAILLDDSTSWVVHPLWRSANNNEWYGQGRQGLLNQVRYDTNGKPTADYPVNTALNAPKLPSSGIPWMVPHSDFFDSDKLSPEWSFLGYTPSSSYSLSTRSGWLTISPKRKPNTIIKNDGEHNYSIITRLDFTAQSVADQAGIWIFNGLQTLYAKLYSSIDSTGNRIVAFGYQTNYYQANNPAKSGNNIVLLRLVRVNHELTGYFSSNGYDWTQVGSSINVADMENLQTNYNAWTGNRQGLFVQGANSADFDYYIYRDAYTPILTECPANQYGASIPSYRRTAIVALDNIHDGDWALYAGVEFGNSEYPAKPDSIAITAACASSGGVVEVWLDSLDSKNKIAECSISNTGSWDTFSTFTAKMLAPVSGNHDVYLKFKGTGSDKLFMLQWLSFVGKTSPASSVGESQSGEVPDKFFLEQNFPNPFNPTTAISYQLSAFSHVTLRICDLLGQEIVTLVNGERSAGRYTVQWDGKNERGELASSGIYLYQLRAGTIVSTRKMILVK
jgi:beta-xylosidase